MHWFLPLPFSNPLLIPAENTRKRRHATTDSMLLHTPTRRHTNINTLGNSNISAMNTFLNKGDKMQLAF